MSYGATHPSHDAHPPPHLGLVCITASEAVRSHTLTRTRLLQLAPDVQQRTLSALYQENLRRPVNG